MSSEWRAPSLLDQFGPVLVTKRPSQTGKLASEQGSLPNKSVSPSSRRNKFRSGNLRNRRTKAPLAGTKQKQRRQAGVDVGADADAATRSRALSGSSMPHPHPLQRPQL
jgi:hypothetical protein